VGVDFLRLMLIEKQKIFLKNNFIPALLPEDDENPKSPTIPMYFDLKRIEL
jgi:hypothetical protein